ncbi:TIGR01440 family protein [Halobacillus shinanisalinarum]|uniref:UPF0340 protein MUO14_08560 n=1 Tax=Halobacillus shinanisalinarum TaxID=2932258 RepID=A0ABY4H3C5_9BACI|nr:TIGR01440 family protein [Halobacillus shinanisalinarum]UOQ94963.1 TIGR01440 family protein [Halobacillus shinanisalinarum]
MTDVQAIQQEVASVVRQLLESGHIKNGLLVIGCSTSEIAGERIGTSGSEAIAEVVYNEWQKLTEQKGIDIAFQCCEHLNRSLLIERSVQKEHNYKEVAAIPVPEAGGSMAAYAYKQMEEPVLVEAVEADAGVDIGDTLIGMHLKRIAVPLRLEQKVVGEAHVTVACTRPPFVGGARAVYEE